MPSMAIDQGSRASDAPGTPSPAALAPLHILIPSRSLAGGKARLGGALDAEEREELILGMLRRTLELVAAWPSAARVHVVSPDEGLLARVASRAVDTIVQRGGGLNEGIRAGREVAAGAGARALLVLPGDLPDLSFIILNGRRVSRADRSALTLRRGAAMPSSSSHRRMRARGRTPSCSRRRTSSTRPSARGASRHTWRRRARRVPRSRS